MTDVRPTGLIGEIIPRPGLAFRVAVGICRFLARVVFDLRLGASPPPSASRWRR